MTYVCLQLYLPPFSIWASTFLAAPSLPLSESTYFIDDQEITITISKTCKSVSNQLKTLIRLKHVLRFEERKMLVNAFVMSSFNYCSLVWNLSSAQMCLKTYRKELYSSRQYVLIMSRTCFRMNIQSTFAWISRNSLLKTVAISDV